MRSFTAHACFVGDDHADGCFLLVLAERDDGSDDRSDDGGARLELRVLDGRDAEDRRMGLDVYSVTTQTGARHHNGVATWTLDAMTLTVRLKSKACAVLDVDEGFTIGLAPVAAQRDQIANALRRIVDG